MRRLVLVFLFLAVSIGCLGPPKAPGEPPDEKSGEKEADRGGKKVPALPAGFLVTRPPRLQKSVPEPQAFWRFVVSYLSTLRADARRKGQDILVTFAGDGVHVTERSGTRRTWRLPDGLELRGTPAHVVLGADLGVRAYRPDGTQVPAAEEITVVGARMDGGREFRLVVKGGTRFRSISNPG